MNDPDPTTPPADQGLGSGAAGDPAGDPARGLVDGGPVDGGAISGSPVGGADSQERASDADDPHNVRELVDVPSIEVISRAAVMLMSSAAEKLGLSEDDPDTAPSRDLDEARRIITALAGLVTASSEYLGLHAAPIRDGLQSLQRAFREASVEPDPPGQGPGEKYTGPVR